MYQSYKNDNQFNLLEDLNKNLGNDLLKQTDINNKQHLYLITNGTNEDTIKKIKLDDKFLEEDIISFLFITQSP